jgi:hypothetical protein
VLDHLNEPARCRAARPRVRDPRLVPPVGGFDRSNPDPQNLTAGWAAPASTARW